MLQSTWHDPTPPQFVHAVPSTGLASGPGATAGFAKHCPIFGGMHASQSCDPSGHKAAWLRSCWYGAAHVSHAAPVHPFTHGPQVHVLSPSDVTLAARPPQCTSIVHSVEQGSTPAAHCGAEYMKHGLMNGDRHKEHGGVEAGSKPRPPPRSWHVSHCAGGTLGGVLAGPQSPAALCCSQLSPNPCWQ